MSTIICEVGTIICDIGTINVRFYLLEVRYPHVYCKITPQYKYILIKKIQVKNKKQKIN